MTIVDVDDLLSAERDENTERKDFTPTEAVAIGRLIEEQEKPLALLAKQQAARIATARKRNIDSDESPESLARGEVRTRVARAVGMGEQKYTQAKAVIEAAESDPQTFGDLPEKMDETGNVHGTFQEMKRRKAGLPDPQPCAAQDAPAQTESRSGAHFSRIPLPSSAPRPRLP